MSPSPLVYHVDIPKVRNTPTWYGNYRTPITHSTDNLSFAIKCVLLPVRTVRSAGADLTLGPLEKGDGLCTACPHYICPGQSITLFALDSGHIVPKIWNFSPVRTVTVCSVVIWETVNFTNLGKHKFFPCSLYLQLSQGYLMDSRKLLSWKCLVTLDILLQSQTFEPNWTELNYKEYLIVR